MQKYSRNKNVTEKNTIRKKRRITYGIAAAVIAIGAIGGVAALEKPKPVYYAPDLQLIQGHTDYDLMAGIEYDEEKYVLSVEDTGSLDINKIGKYQVTYALTPIGETGETEETETLETEETRETETQETIGTAETAETETSETETKESGNSSESPEAPSAEETKESTSESPETPSAEESKESTSESPETPSAEESKESTSESPEAPSAEENTTDQGGALEEVTPENGDEAKAFTNTILRSMFATVSAAEIESQETVVETPAESGNPAESESPEPAAPVENPAPAETPEPGVETPGTETPSTETPGIETPSTETPGIETPGTETPGTETPGTETPGTETPGTGNPGTETPGTETSETETSETSGTETAETEETLGEAETFTRTVWVVTGSDGFYLGYEDENVKVNASLYTLEQEEGSEEYKLVLNHPETFTAGLRATDENAQLIAGTEFSVTDDAALQNAIKVEEIEGKPVITGIKFGTYTIEVSATHPENGRTLSCTRTVTIEGLFFDAPLLHIGTKNDSYDLLQNVTAVDENGTETEVYVVSEDELLKAKETVVDEITGEETEQFIVGTYHVILGAKHPETGIEYTVEREVEVVEGYYIYAPFLKVEEGTTDYDLLEGVEVRNPDDESVVEDVEVIVEDMSELLENAMTEEELAEYMAVNPAMAVETFSLAEEEQEPADTEKEQMPALKAGIYMITLAAENTEDGEKLTVERSISVQSTLNTGAFYYESLNPDKKGYLSSVDGIDDVYQREQTGDMYQCGQIHYWINNNAAQADLDNSWHIPQRAIVENSFMGEAGLGIKYQEFRKTSGAGNGYDNHRWIGQKWGKEYGNPWEESRTIGQWSTFLNNGAHDSTSLKEGGKADVTITAQQDLTASVFKLGLITVPAANMLLGYDQDSSVLFDGNGYKLDSNSLSLTSAGSVWVKNFKLNTVQTMVGNSKRDYTPDIKAHMTYINPNSPSDGYLYKSPSWFKISGVTVDNTSTRDTGKYINISGNRFENGSVEVVIDEPENPVYSLSEIGNLTVKSGQEDAINAIEVIMNTEEKVSDTEYRRNQTFVDTTDGGSLSFYQLGFNIGDYSFNNVNITLKGNGKLIMANRVKSTYYNTEEAENNPNTVATSIPAINANTLSLESNVHVEKSNLRPANAYYEADHLENTYAIRLTDKLVSNGYKITFSGNGYDLTTEDEPVVGYNRSMLQNFGWDVSTICNKDATDYALELTQKDGRYYYLTLDDDARKVVVTSSDNLPIQVSPAIGGVEYYADYKAALGAIRDNGNGSAYTITNHQDVDFGYGDTQNETVKALAAITSGKASSLKFTSAVRTKGAQGNYGERYLVRMRPRTMILPADVPVTFENMVMKYDQGTQGEVKAVQADGTKIYEEDLVFDANGSKLTFAGTMSFWKGSGVDETQMYPIIYGQGSPAAKTLGITPGSKANLIVEAGVNLAAGDVYNYNTLTNKGTLEITRELLAQKDADTYKGDTILGEGSEFILSNASGRKSIGSLKAAADAVSRPKLKLARVADAEGKSASDKSNPYLLNITAAQPLAKLKQDVQKIEVSYCSGTETNGDIIFNLPKAAARTDITVEPLFSAFSSQLLMIADKNQSVIVLAEAYVLLIDQNGDISPKKDVAGAIVELAADEEKTPGGGGTYTIAFYKDGYTLSDLDRDAMEYASGRKTGTFTYLGDDYTNIQQASNAAKITWCSNYASDGNVTPDSQNEITVTGDMNFFGTENVLENITVNATADYDIYANGSRLTIEKTFVNSGNLPNVYGGGTEEDLTKETLLVLKAGKYNSVYGGNKNETSKGVKSARIELDNIGEVVSICNYDQLKIAQKVTVTGELNSEKVAGYAGETILAGEAEFTLEKADGIKRIGSLKMDETAISNATLTVARAAADTAGRDASDKDNEYLLNLTQASPLEARNTAIILKYTNEREEELNDVVISMKNAEESRMTDDAFTAGFSFYGIEADAGEKTIRLVLHKGLYDWDTGEWLDDPDVKTKPRPAEALLDMGYVGRRLITNPFDGLPNVDKINKKSIEKDVEGWSVIYAKGALESELNNDNIEKQVSLKYLDLSSYGGGTNQTPRSGKFLSYEATDTKVVFRADSWKGNGDGWDYHGVSGTNNQLAYNYCLFWGWKGDAPNLVIQIKNSDTSSVNPAYMVSYGGYAGYVQIKAGDVINDNQILIRALKRIDLYTENEGNMMKLGSASLGSDSYGGEKTQLVLHGDGTVLMSTNKGTGYYDGDSGQGKILAGQLVLKGNVHFATNCEGDHMMINEVISDGHKLNASRSSNDKFAWIPANTDKNEMQDLTEGYVYAKTIDATGKLDATDFFLEKPLEGTTGLFLTSRNNSTEIYVAKLATKPIQVTPAVGGESYFDSYKLALEAVEAGGTGTEYTITNLIERDFTAEDYAALQAITADKASGLIFESGDRGTGNTDGAAGTRYRVRMRVQTLEMPKGVDVTFQNMVMKYDQGENSEIDGSQDMVFIGNGNKLKFGEGVVFLQHNDETMKPTVYGGSITGTNDTLSTVIINSGTFKAVYGAGTVPQTKGTNVSISGGTVDKLFAGGTGAGTVTGDTSITVSGGNINCPVYGGGEGAKVTGNTTVVVSGGNFDNSTDKSVYGGGKGAEVEGKADVTITIDNSAGEKTLLCKNVSACGTDADGNLADNVKKAGTRNTITINSKVMGDGTKKAGLELECLTGFDTLTIGNKGETENNNFILSVTRRFDSRVVDKAVEDNTREDVVTLQSVWLKLLGEDWQGHIGQLVTNGKCALTIFKNANGTKPLLADQVPTLDTNTANKVQLKASNGINEMGDIMVTFTFRQERDDDVVDEFLPKKTYNYFEDGLGTGLTVSQTQTGTGANNDPVNILFAVPPAHTVASFVEYPVVNGKTTLDARGTVNQKILHFSYDKENKHNVMGGYVVALPKSAVTDAAAGNETEMLKYTATDTTFMTDGQSFTAETQALNPVRIAFTQDTTKPGQNPEADPGTTVYEAYGYTVDDQGNKKAVDIDNENYWYVAHIVCDHGENYTFLLDVEAPKASAAAVKVLGTELDTKTDSYIYTVEVTDPSETSSQNLPYYTVGYRTKRYLTYTGNGVQAGYYSISATLDTPDDKADVEATKNPNTRWDVDRPVTGETTGLYDTVEVTKRDGGKPVPGNTPAVITATIPRELVENNQQGAVWAYAKDDLNNTVKIQIPLNDYIIDVSVPLEVNVIAVKKRNGGAMELLAPTCYVVNNGTKEIEAKVNGFVTTPLQDLHLVEKTKAETFNADEISLFIKGTAGNTFTETNVLSLDKNPLGIGILGKSTEDTKTKAFTFDAAYDVRSINMPDGFMKNTMSYHFSVVEGGN